LFRLDTGQVYRAEVLNQFPWLEHGFGTRSSSAWPGAQNLATVRQIHSNKVIVATRPGDLGEGDALISNVPGLTLVVRTADCLPILIADPENRAVAAVHAGWRGTVQEIVLEAVQAMASEYGSRPESLVIAIGPGIGACCYEVGPDVAQQFSRFFPERQDLNGSVKIDLPESTVRQLRRNGGRTGQIDSSGLCTRCLADHFHSYRRDGAAAGRMISTIGIRLA
jgi:purine-nucleoside/S-methyl-5'-thioadenosine phosphorylase / adenosine deaminase